MGKENNEERPAIIKFDDPQGKKPAETVTQMKNRLRRTDSTVSQGIIAYRTLSINVSESQAKGVKHTKKTSKDLADGKYVILLRSYSV